MSSCSLNSGCVCGAVYRCVFQGDLLQLKLKLHGNLLGTLQLLILHAHLLLLPGDLEQRLDLQPAERPAERPAEKPVNNMLEDEGKRPVHG